MTIQNAIDRLDTTRPNKLTDEQKIAWLSALDGQVYRELILTHEKPPVEGYDGYTSETDRSTELLVHEPYTQVYTYWLCAQVDLVNAEIGKYNNDMTLYNNAFKAYGDWYTRTHMPKRRVWQFRM